MAIIKLKHLNASSRTLGYNEYVSKLTDISTNQIAVIPKIGVSSLSNYYFSQSARTFVTEKEGSTTATLL